MILLYNGCSCSDIAVHPKNWQTSKADMNIKWYIHYRFYDPAFPKPKLVSNRGMNHFTDRSQRQEAVKVLLQEVEKLLKDEGYNPITKSFYVPPDDATDINPRTPFIKALWMVEKTLTGVQGTLLDIRSVIRGTDKAAKFLNYDKIPIGEISRKHIKLILEQCKTNPKFSANRHNKYRTYLIKLFKELIELDAVTYNFPRDISKMRITQTARLTLTTEERKLVSDHLYRVHRPFWKFMQIFFHSGSRITELMLLQAKNVNLKTQKYKCVIKKGKEYREVWRTIKDSALPLWEDQLSKCNPEDYLWSKGLEPGAKPVRREQIDRRWRRLVMIPLGIKATFYGLKHLNTDEVVELLNLNDAAAMNGHLNTSMVASVYAINEKERQHERLRKLGNRFS